MSILLIDSYDSFSCSLERLLEESTGARVTTVRNDSFHLPEDINQLDNLLNSLTAVVIGPGPGSPSNPADIGIIPYILTKRDLPILGICLGFQCLCLANGCNIKYLKDPVHGQAQTIEIDHNDDLFTNVPARFKSVRYHSIYVEEDGDSIIPLAHCQGRLMAGKHRTYPHYGIQYHPESICSKYGHQQIANFWAIASKLRPEKEIGNCPQAIHYKPMIKDIEYHNRYIYQFKELDRKLDPLDVCDKLDDFLLLNSASEPGEWSIIGIPDEGSDVITYYLDDPAIVKTSHWKSKNRDVPLDQSIWDYLAGFMASRFQAFQVGSPLLQSCPFKGGLIGLVSYEAGSNPTTKTLNSMPRGTPDIKMCFIRRFIAIHRSSSRAFIVSIIPDDGVWMKDMIDLLGRNLGYESKEIPNNVRIIKPDKKLYESQFHECQKYLHTGDSYELCLTTTTKISIPSSITLWDVYQKMVAHNPSPYSAFLDFGDVHLLSTSPERFLYWDRSKVQMRPIKGTVSKQEAHSYKEAESKLLIPKEMGENLMIVDLIRHDLYSLLKKVEVPQLMGVEEYETVYQLVTVIEGELKNTQYSGIDVLKHALPPGSMTGAPKKRAVEILEKLEGYQRRGIYSGVAGYWSIDDTADWSVVIRSLYGYHNSKELMCGAGGAITVLSNCESEWQELNTKLVSAIRTLD